MKLLLAAAVFAAAATAALAGTPKTSCIDPHRSYMARPLNQHDIIVQTTIGKPKPPMRMKTTCIFLEPAISVRFSSAFTCVGQGDTVMASTVDGRKETCRVARVLPYEPQEGDLKR